jgi:hypothetical protein
MIEENPPLLFEPYLGMLRPANRAAQEAMPEIRGRVAVKISGGKANQKRRGLYWACAGLVTPLLNDAHNLTLSIRDLHDISRDKLGLVEEILLPSGEIHKRRRSTSNRAMPEHERAEYTTRALELWSRWCGVPVETLRIEADKNA